MGPSSGAAGVMTNPRDYALPGNQEPDTPWPDSMVLLSAIAAVTTRLRLALGAIIAPLRHPLLLAKQLATLDLLSEGRLVVLPTVSWHRDEYEALGVPFNRRGALLDEHLAAWRACWRDSPASFEGEHYAFRDVYVEPKPYRPEGPTMWFGGSTIHDRLLRRLVEYGHGFNPLGQPTPGGAAAPRRGDARGGPRPRRPGVGRRHPRPLLGRRRPRGRRRGARGGAGAGRTRLPLHLLQAVDVHERPRRRRPPLPPRGRAGERAGGGRRPSAPAPSPARCPRATSASPAACPCRRGA